MAETVANQLRLGIIAGDFPPGARMRQEDLAERLNVSRGPVRQALVILEREGLVRADRWRGAIVTPLDVPLIKDLYEFRGAVERFVAELKGGKMPVRRGEPDGADVIFESPRALPLLRVFYGKYPLEEVEAQGELKVAGDRALARRFVDLFALPEKIA